jgi:hypothetical protein
MDRLRGLVEIGWWKMLAGPTLHRFFPLQDDALQSK